MLGLIRRGLATWWGGTAVARLETLHFPEAILVYLGLTGEAFYILERGSDRVLPQEIWTFHPHRFKEVVDKKTGLISGWVYSKSARQIPLAPHEIIFFRYFNPYHDYRGLSPLQAARAGVEQDHWASRYNTAFFKNSAQPGGVLETTANLNDEEYQRVLAQWRDRHGGASKAHAIALLEGGLTYKQTGLSQKDMDFLEQMHLTLYYAMRGAGWVR